MSYRTRKINSTGVDVNGTTVTKLFATPNPRVGWGVAIPAGVSLWIREQPTDTAAPAAADMNAGQSFAVPGPYAYESGATQGSDVYILTNSGAATTVKIYPEEFLA
jgi:hypothetical protein